MEEKEKKVKQNLMFNVTGYPEEKFTENGERYYYTRPDGTPITGSNWSLKDLAYPLNLLFGGKSPTDESWGLEEGSQEQLNAELSKHSFGSWLVNSAPSQILPFLGGAKKLKQVQSNKKVMKDMKYQENVEDVTGFGDKQIGFRVDNYLNSINNLSLVDKENIQKLKGIKNKGLLNPIFTAKELGLDPTGTTFYSMGDLGIGDTGFGYNVRKKKSIREYRSQLFNEAGFRRDKNGNFVFNVASLKNFLKGEKRRLASQVAQTKEGQTVINSFAKTKNQTLPEFVDTYGGYMLLTGSKPNLHHEFAAMVSADLYDGIVLDETPGSDWMRLTELLNQNNIFPGSPVTDPASLGGPQSNLTQLITKGRKGAPPEPHDILHHQFYKDMKLQDVDEGKASFWDSRRWKMKTIEGRLEVAQEYADIVNEGNRIIKESMSQINALFGKNTDPEIIVNLMSKLADSGQLKIAGTNYRLKSVESIVKIIKDEVMANMPLADEQEVLKTVAQYDLTFDQEIDAIDLLHDIADYNESMRVRGQRPPSITLKKHKENIAAYMNIIQGKLPLDEVGYNQKAKALEDFTYKRVKPIPIQKQLEILFPEREPTQLNLFNK